LLLGLKLPASWRFHLFSSGSFHFVKKTDLTVAYSALGFEACRFRQPMHPKLWVTPWLRNRVASRKVFIKSAFGRLSLCGFVPEARSEIVSGKQHKHHREDILRRIMPA
jgi:hypothetical protein